MNAITLTKKVFGVAMLLFFVFGLFNTGSYNSQNRLAVFSTDVAMASPSSSSSSSSSYSYKSCNVDANVYSVTYGSDLTISWTTQGYSHISLNGETVSGSSGTKTFSNIKVNTTYTLVATNPGSSDSCTTSVTVLCLPAPLPACELTPANKTIQEGESVTLNWTTTNASSVTLTNFGTVANSGSKSTGPLTADKNYTLTVVGVDGSTVSCHSAIKVEKIVTPPPTCTLTPVSTTIANGESVTLNWTTTNASSVTLTNFGTVANSGSQNTGALNASQNYTLTVLGLNGSTVTCNSNIVVQNTPPAPLCESFTASPSTITRGNASTLTWQTKNATRVVIDNAIGEVSASGSTSVAPLATTEFTLKVYGQNNQEAVCKTTVTVNEPPEVLVPECTSFTANPSTLPFGGGTSTLTWQTKNASSVSISPIFGSVEKNGSRTASIATTTIYTLTAGGTGTSTVSCTTKVEVLPPVPVALTCANNVSLSVSPTSVRRGDSATLNWTTNGVTSVSFDQGVSATGLNGSFSVSPNSRTTYTMTVSDGKTSASCPVTLDVTTGGGGGGSVSPSCELSVSKTRISRGEEVTLRWDSTRATEVELVDSFRNVLMTTKDRLSDDKEELFDGSIRVSPKQDTTFIFTAKRGSRDDVCKVSVDVGGGVVVSQVRTQQPLIAGISLAQVPYTGFEAGPIMTATFYLLLMAWALYLAYLIVIRRDSIGGLKLAEVPVPHTSPTPEIIRPDVFVASVKVPEVRSTLELPDNLPVGNPIVGYASVAGESATISTNPHHADDRTVTAIENHAHKRKVLLSSDAIRHFIGTTTNEEERIDALDEVISLAKSQFPSEDGWVVINEKRMKDLCVTCSANQIKSTNAPYIPAVIPEGSGSLAEAIVTGNVVAAYEMIGNRPMFALADASADLDAVYRVRKGATNIAISELLMQESARLSDEQIMQMIKALTSALDGVYTDEASAVKMAIMKAVKVAA
ncbi:MAG: hypothetical protein R3B53_02120 [Candidatus Paceibacterota bacterium]